MIVQTDPRAPRVVLVGPPGAGKSTIGRKLARELGVELYDTDAGIERETGRTIPEIFATDGEPEFRKIEERVVRRAVLTERGVVSLGGGAVLSEHTRALLRGRTVVYLEISVAEGLRRTGASSQRPLLNGADPGAKYRELMRERRPLYREVATVRVRTDGRSPGRVVRMILAKLGMESVAPSTDPEPETSEEAPGSQVGRRSRTRRRARARAAARRRSATAETTEPTPRRTTDPAPSQRSRRGRGRRSASTAAKTGADADIGVSRTGDAATGRIPEAGTDRAGVSPPRGGDTVSASPTTRHRARKAHRPAGAPDTHVTAGTETSESARSITSDRAPGTTSGADAGSGASVASRTGALPETDGRDRGAEPKRATGDRQSERPRRRRAPRTRPRAEKQSAYTESERRT